MLSDDTRGVCRRRLAEERRESCGCGWGGSLVGIDGFSDSMLDTAIGTGLGDARICGAAETGGVVKEDLRAGEEGVLIIGLGSPVRSTDFRTECVRSIGRRPCGKVDVDADNEGFGLGSCFAGVEVGAAVIVAIRVGIVGA